MIDFTQEAAIERLAELVAERVRSKLAQDNDGLMDIHGAAEFLGCSVPTVERLTRSGQIPSMKMGKLRKYQRRQLIEHLTKTS